MFENILVPVDGSDTAALALEKATALAEKFKSKITLLCVMEPYPALTMNEMDLGLAQQQYAQVAEQHADTTLERARATLAALLPTQVQIMKIEAGSAWRGIVETAHLLEVDLIVMGSHGRKGLERLELGSVAQKVVSHAERSVLVVHAKA